MDEEKQVTNTGIRVGNDVFTSLELCEGNNVKLVVDGGKVFISAPVVNQTKLKQGPFVISGDVIEVEAGPNIRISSAMPNKLVIGADISKETLRIISLEQRIESLEKAVAGLLKRKP